MPARVWVQVLVLMVSVMFPLALTSNAEQSQSEALAKGNLTADQIMERVKEANQRRADNLLRYSGMRTYHLDYRGLVSLSADMVVQAEFVAPGIKRFRVVSERGSSLIRARVFKPLLAAEEEASIPENQRRTALVAENYNFEYVGEQTIGKRGCYVIAVSPHTESKFLYRGKIWIDTEDYAVVQIEAEPAKNPSFWINKTEVHHEYEKIDEFWVPSINRTVSDLKLRGTAVLTINYTKYTVLPRG